MHLCSKSIHIKLFPVSNKPHHAFIPAGDFQADDAVLVFAESGPRHFLYRVNVFDDSVAEGLEELFVNLSAAAGPADKGVAFHRNAAQLTIVDDDSKTIITSLIVLLSTAVPPGFKARHLTYVVLPFFCNFIILI